MEHGRDPQNDFGERDTSLDTYLNNDESPEEETERLIACIEAGIARKKRRLKTARYICFANYIVGFLLFMTILRFAKAHPILVFGGVFTNSLVNTFNERVCKGWARFEKPAEQAAIRQLVARDDPCLVGVLIDALFWCDDSPLRDLLRGALSRLLPYLTEDQVHALGKERHGILTLWMQRWDKDNAGKDPVLLVEILYVLATVGRGSVETEKRQGRKATVNLLPILQPWTLGKRAGEDPSVRKVATFCRDAILSNQANARSGEQLLRAANTPDLSTNDLLHPVQGVPETDPQQLLRPGTSHHNMPEA